MLLDILPPTLQTVHYAQTLIVDHIYPFVRLEELSIDIKRPREHEREEATTNSNAQHHSGQMSSRRKWARSIQAFFTLRSTATFST